MAVSPSPGPGPRGPVAALSALALLADPFDGRTSQSSLRVRSTPRPASDPLVRRRVYLGRSVKGRPIYAVELGIRTTSVGHLAVGLVHGNETAGLAVTRDLASARPPKEAQLWIVNDLNPDGSPPDAAERGRRRPQPQLPLALAPAGAPGDLTYSGRDRFRSPRPGSHAP